MKALSVGLTFGMHIVTHLRWTGLETGRKYQLCIKTYFA